MRTRAAAFGVMVFVLTIAAATLAGAQGGSATLGGVGAMAVPGGLAGYATYRASLWLADRAGRVALALTFPSGEQTPYDEQFSYVDSLAARGDVAGALQEFERIIAERPLAVTPRLKAAELYASRGANPTRAAALFRQVRGIEGVNDRDAVYACSRLVDLYDGALDQPGRALVELRRIIELYPFTPVAARARDALPRLKARLLDGEGRP